MLNHSCINGTLAGSDKYSSPVPVIGLYIAAASAVCSLLMLYDIVDAFIKRQRWLPCKLFKLNSVTLSLIGVVVKLTVDLTTSMPSALDQLSKLAGTTSLCIYMCYVFPYVGDMKDSTNMFAVSILVITVFVNMCIQFSTGLIVSFIPEHIAILCLMLLLLLIPWHYVLTTKSEITSSIEHSRSGFLEGVQIPESFLERLERVFKDGFESNPQIVACRLMECGIVGDLSLISWAILTQAAIRTIDLNKEILCIGKSSDYGWSMGAIVATQLAMVTIGTFASYARRCTMTTHVFFSNICIENPIKEPYFSNPIWARKFRFLILSNVVYSLAVFINYWLFAIPIVLFNILKSGMSCEFLEGFAGYTVHDAWLTRKTDSELKKLRESSNRKSRNLRDLLKKIVLPPQSEDSVDNPPRYQGPRPRDLVVSDNSKRLRARLLPLVVLVRIVDVAIRPESRSRNIILSFREAFETLHFIDKHIYNTCREDIKETEVAKAVWTAPDFNHLLPSTSRRSNQFDEASLDRAFHAMDKIDEIMPNNDPVGEEVKRIRHLVMLRGTYSSVEELSNFMEDLFLDLLDPMLAQLPEAIFKAVASSPVEEYETRVRQSIEHLCKFISWEGIARWEPPKGCQDCYNLLHHQNLDASNTEDTATVSRNDMLTFEVPAAPPVQVTATMSPGDTQNEGNNICRSDEHHVTIKSYRP